MPPKQVIISSRVPYLRLSLTDVLTVSAVCLHCILIVNLYIAPTDASEDQYSYSFEKNTLETTCALLSKFLGGDPERELQALIALQELMDDLQHPSG